MPSSPVVVVIAAPERLLALQARFADAEVFAFADTDVLRALETILTRRPAQVVLERVFASTTRGMALVSRLRADPLLRSLDVAVLAHDGAPAPVPLREGAPVRPVAAPVAAPLDQRGTRRAPRVRVRDGLDILVDGSPVRLVDLSTLGAQVLSAGVLKPNQRVRVSLVDEAGAIRLGAVIAWAAFELPQGSRQTAQYRAGLEFLDAQPEAVAGFALRHERRDPTRSSG